MSPTRARAQPTSAQAALPLSIVRDGHRRSRAQSPLVVVDSGRISMATTPPSTIITAPSDARTTERPLSVTARSTMASSITMSVSHSDAARCWRVPNARTTAIRAVARPASIRLRTRPTRRSVSVLECLAALAAGAAEARPGAPPDDELLGGDDDAWRSWVLNSPDRVASPAPRPP